MNKSINQSINQSIIKRKPPSSTKAKQYLESFGISEQISHTLARCLLRLCRNESVCKTIHMKMCSPYRLNQTHFHMKRFARGLGFETEAQGNSKMAYCNFCGYHSMRVDSVSQSANIC